MRIFPPLTLACCLLTAVTGAWAHGNVQCPNEPRDQWRGQMELQRKLVADGWRVRQVKTFNTCYEVYGFDEKGQRVEAFFNPKTFERIPEDAPAKQ